MRIFVEDYFLGTHQWDTCNLPEVEFLKNEHHHNFHVRIECNIKHNDREIEFLILRIWLRKIMATKYVSLFGIIRFGSKSCEMIGEEIKYEFEKEFGKIKVKVIVSEDKIQGGIVE